MMPWTPFHNGQSIGTPGPENGRISRDDEHVLGARITLQQSEPNVFARTAPCALTCGIYGWMFHTRFFGNAAAATGVLLGVIIIAWMSLPDWFDIPPHLRVPLHANLAIVVGTLAIFLVGLAASRFSRRP